MTEEKNNSRTIIYYDPNEVDDNLDLMKPLEDYSISVDLEVDIPSRDNYMNKETYTLSWKSKGGDNEASSASFFKGSKIGGSDVLTTFYTDINFDKNRPIENTEAIGISSINIDYDSWYLPKVTIKFVDLRGGALFNSAQFFEDADQPSNNLFRAFFTIPYPLFKLRVKGFYGDSITLPLYLIDFRAEFNSSTGDFEIITQFVGYTYAFLADIPFNFLKSAPYNRIYGKDYWTNQVENGNFYLVDENNNNVHPMPTLIELMTNISNAQQEVKKLMANDSDVNTFSKVKSDHSSLKTITDLWSRIVSYFSADISGNVIKYNSNDSIIQFINNDKDTWEISKSKDDIKNLIDNINEAIKNYNEKVEDVETDLLPDIKINISPVMLEDVPSDNEWVEQIKNDGKLDSKINKETYYYKLDNSNFWGKINTISDNNVNNLLDSKETIANKIEDIVTGYIGFKPTVNNIFRIIFAHLETFMKTYYEVLDEITLSGRTVSDYFNDVDDTDINTQDIGNTFLSPFPGTYNNGEEIWIGKIHKEMEEVKYVYSIIEAVNETRKVEDNLIVLETEEEKGYWLPINPFDTFLTNRRNVVNPYMNLSTSDFRDVVINIGLRMFYGVSLYSENISDKDIKRLASIEAKNIVDALNTNNSIMNKFSINGIVNTIEDILMGSSNIDEEYPMTNYTFPNAIKRDGIVKSVLMNRRQINGIQHYSLEYLRKGDTQNNYSILPLYVDNFKNIKNDWFCNNEINTVVHDGVPFITNSQLSIQDVSNSKTFFSIHENLNDFIEYKEKIDTINGSALTNWDLTTDHISGLFNVADNNLFVDDYTEGNNNKDKINYLDSIYDKDKITIFNNKNDRSKKNWFGNYGLKSRSTNFLSARNNDLNVIYPTIGFDYNNGIAPGGSIGNGTISVFGSPFYYGQNDKENKRRLNEKESKVDDVIKLSKGVIFLSSLPLNIAGVNELFNLKNNGVRRVPKIIMLKIGAILWRYRYAIEKGIDPVHFPTAFYKEPDNIFTFLKKPLPKSKTSSFIRNLSGNDKYTRLSNTFLNNIIDKNNNLIIKEPIVNQIINYFIEWVNDKKGFEFISNELELKIKNSDGTTYSNNNSYSIDNKIGIYLNKLSNNKLTTKDLYDDFGDKLFENYIRIYPIQPLNNIKGFVLEHRGGTQIMRNISDLLTDDVVIINTSFNNKKNNNNNGFNIKESSVKNYLTTLVNEINRLHPMSEKHVNREEVTIYNNDAVSLAIYRNLKNIYDKWAASKELNYYTLNNFYKYNFKFIDKFYNDIGNDLIINIEIFNDILKGTYTNDSTNLYSVLSELLSKHEMLFIPSASNVNWVQNKDTLEKVFKPIPYAQQTNDESNPGFTGIYVGQPSSNLAFENDKNKMADDALRVHPLSNFPNKDDNIPSFPIPCFSVSYGKQNQSYFTDFNVGMTNPINTEQALQSIYDLSQRGGSSTRISQGQELYKIYTRNSYQVTANMLGCAQIQPMMYFQLSNIPLFNGCYMIYKVNHTITPGDMKTSFTGMRMSRVAPMYTKEPFIYKSFLADFDDLDISRLGVKNETEGKSSVNSSNVAWGSIGIYNGGVRTADTKYKIKKDGNTVYPGDNAVNSTYGASSVGYTEIDKIGIEYVNYPLLKDKQVSKRYKLKDFVEKSNSNASGGKSFDDAGKVMPFRVYENILNFAPLLDVIHDMFNGAKNEDGEPLNTTHKLHIESLWRVKWHPNGSNTFHGAGSAVDIHVLKKSGGKDEGVMKSLFNQIKNKLSNNISELFFEKSQSNSNSYWIHYAYNPNSNKKYINDNFSAS